MAPPRRSTRSSRGSVEPTTTAKPVAANKRKRTQPTDDIDDSIEEQENARRPATRTTRRSSSVKPTAPAAVRTRTSTRSGSALREVQESDEEDDEIEALPPPPKKSRPSTDLEDVNEEDEDVKPKLKTIVRGKRASVRSTAAAKKGKPVKPEVIVIEDSDEDGAPEAITQPPARRSTSRKSSVPASSAPRGRSTRGTSKPVKNEPLSEEDSVEQMVDEADEDEEPQPVKPVRGRMVPLKRTSGGGIASTSSMPEASPDESEPDEVKPAPRKGRKRTVASPEREPIDDDEAAPDQVVPDSDEAMEHLEVPSDPRKDRPVTPPPYEEEKSLLDTLPPSPSKRLPPEEPQGPKPRLVIHKMALVNFKSYAGRQEIGPFHKSFSAIVGPNGSGKSNTIDALLFVFGYRASKMRQAKLSELIHNSAQYPDLDNCSVEIHFREIMDLPGPDAFTVIPNSSLVVTRTAYKNNSSKYTINGRASNYKEVQTLLKGRGIDLDHNRFLILQGEVESIAQMKPKAPSEHEDGLLEYLEDIIGTSQYKEPIETSLAEIEKLVEDRVEKMNRLKIVEREKNALEAKKREAEDYLRLQNEHVRAQSLYFQFCLYLCYEHDQKLEKIIAQTKKELAEERDRNKDDIALLESQGRHYQERVVAYEEVKKAAAVAMKDMAAHEKQQVGLEEKRKHALGKAKKLKKSLHDDEKARDESLRAIGENATTMQSEKEKVDDLEEKLQHEEKILEGIRDSLKDKTQVFHDQIEQKQKELQPWTAKINTKQAEIDVKTSERDMLVKKAETIKEASKEASDNLEKLQADQEGKLGDLQDLKRRKQTLQQESTQGQKRLRDMQARVSELRTKSSSSRQRVDEAKASQAASTSQNRVEESLKKLKSAGRITGFHGRLGTLGTIDDKYDVAISTACGQLHNMVVDTVDQGQACIEYLRNQNIGRASFIVLDKLNYGSSMAPIQTPENAPRLFDLIKFKEERFKPAFYKALSNTLVAQDLAQANRIAFGSQKRWRVVTLAGQLIDSSGTMSGGGNHVAKGGMSSKLAADAVSPDTLRGYERDSEAVARQLDEAVQELKQAEAEVDAVTRSGPQIDLSIDKINLDIKTGSQRIAEAERRINDLKAQSKPNATDVARISALEREIASATSDLQSLQQRSGTIEEAVKALEKKILDIGGSKLLAQKSKVEGIKLHINLANDEITKAEVAKAKAEKDSVKLASAVEAHAKDLKEVEKELQELTSDLEKVSAFVEELREMVDEAQAAVENQKDDLEQLKKDLDEKTEAIQEFKKKEMELEQQLADKTKEAAENAASIEHWNVKHDELELIDIDDDDDDEQEEGPQVEADEDGTSSKRAATVKVKREHGEAGSLGKKGRQQTSANELRSYTKEELRHLKKQELIGDVQILHEQLERGKPNLGVLKEYKQREEEFMLRAKHLEDTTNLRDAEKAKYDALTKQRLDEFMTGFSAISLKLKEMYQMITLGGNAELELVDSMDPFSEGIIFSVMPPKKSWRNISNLSGGEKTLSSLALVFALHVFKPTPLYFMDEIDAALDFRNVSIVANYIKDRTKNAQFIIISLRNDMFELSHRLIGIYKTSNQTRSISIDNRALQAPPSKSTTKVAS
ncbi:hypothetical protein BV25DRAFT_1849078 [Artomyces pyxidatus]|uniref:Uncharacterized protein n=1 Tax=Artomyces pyxidatus TaxID=48021 RepID=A0ACB8TDN9_9AGAM|nr:hypothetical protein BV25DRAFT_1849078 [Artomyces pyxidatus]